MSRRKADTRRTWRLVPLLPAGSGVEWVVSGDRVLTIGRSRAAENSPDINLWPDRLVSRSHASLYQDGGVCWLRDSGSKLGTRVNGDAIAAGVETQVQAGGAIECGRTKLLLLGPEWQLLAYGPLRLAARLPSFLGYGLSQSRRRVVSELRFYNASRTELRPAKIELTLGKFARAAADVPPLGAGEFRGVSDLVIEPDLEALESARERQEREWSVSVDGQAFSGTSAATSILAYNEVLFTAEHRPSWATFVLPNHPLVTEVATLAVSGMSTSKPAPDVALEAVYQVLHSAWRIGYRDEPPHYGADAQKVRLAHDALSGPASRTGEGTCLDLALLAAGALESLGVQPLVAVVEEDSKRHALVGCWNESRLRLEPIVLDRDRLLARAAWIDPTGCVRDRGQRRSVSAARQAAETFLQNWNLLFALDVSAARQDGIMPAPLSGEPQWSEPVARVLDYAQAAANEARAQLSVVCLFVGMLRLSEGSFRQTFAAAHQDPDEAAAKIVAALPPVEHAVKPSRHYHEVLGASRAAAKVDGMAFVTERHLAVALLDIRSTALDQAFSLLGTSRAALRADMAAASDSADTTEGSSSVFPSNPDDHG